MSALDKSPPVRPPLVALVALIVVVLRSSGRHDGALSTKCFEVETEKKLGIEDKKYKKRFVKVLARRRKVNLVDPTRQPRRKF